MGRPKLTLPWGQTTVIGRVVTVLAEAGVADIVVVTGGARAGVEAALVGLPARPAYNPQHTADSMMVSLQVGLRALSLAGEGASMSEAAFVTLGDQPQIEAAVVRGLIDAHHQTGAALAAPSYQRRRGHPWLLGRSLWSEALAAPATLTLRDFLVAHRDQIHYFAVDTPSVLADLDTPADYTRFRP
jgi:CTP:molybdopterin cytidylyltransferase MocA